LRKDERKMEILGIEKRRTKKKVIGLFLILVITAMCQQERTEAVIVIAHRGASRAAPENTLAAMRKAIEYGADYAECDVFQTKDGKLVLFHDQELERTTGKTGMIWEYTLAELKEMEVGSWFNEEFRGEPIPTLREVIHLVKGKMKLNIEVKVSGEDPEIARNVVDVIRSENMGDECMVTSFEKSVIVDVKQMASELRTGYIFDEEHPPDIFEGEWEYVCSKHNIVDRAFVRKARQKGKKVFVWTVDSPQVMKKMIDVGVDGIITDVPDVLKQVITSIRENN
jgi:glycerophosphoryl diester phosphodiesterase